MPPKRKFSGPSHNSSGSKPWNNRNQNNPNNPNFHTNKRQRLPPPPPLPLTEVIPPLLQKLTTSLHRSLKLSRSIELKKCSRRLQTSIDEKQDEATQQKHTNERTILLALDLRMAARRLMQARIKRDRAVKEKLDALGAKVPSEEGDDKVGKEQEILVARLGGYKVVRENLGNAVEGVRKALGMEETLQATHSEAESESEDDGWQERKAERIAGEMQAMQDARDKKDREDMMREEAGSESDEDSTEGEDDDGVSRKMDGLAVSSENEQDEDGEGWETNSEGEMVRVGRHDAMEVDDLESDVEGGWETNSDGEMVQIKPTKLVSRHLSDSEAETEPSKKSKKDPKEKEKKKEKEPKKKLVLEKPKSSTFLPSLMHGYVSGSDSEVEDIDDRANNRKNRRGQRARRAIWEKKYGENAEFKKKMRAKGIYMDDKGRRIDPARAAFIDGSGGKGHIKSGGPAGAGGFKAGGTVAPHRAEKPKPPRKRDDDGPIHPSWEAARKKKAEAGPIAFQGKKITFD